MAGRVGRAGIGRGTGEVDALRDPLVGLASSQILTACGRGTGGGGVCLLSGQWVGPAPISRHGSSGRYGR